MFSVTEITHLPPGARTLLVGTIAAFKGVPISFELAANFASDAVLINVLLEDTDSEEGKAASLSRIENGRMTLKLWVPKNTLGAFAIKQPLPLFSDPEKTMAVWLNYFAIRISDAAPTVLLNYEFIEGPTGTFPRITEEKP